MFASIITDFTDWLIEKSAKIPGRALWREMKRDATRAFDRGGGVLFFSGHYGHWELGAIVNGFLGFPLAVIARPLNNPALEQMLGAMRSVSGNQVLYKRNAVRAAENGGRSPYRRKRDCRTLVSSRALVVAAEAGSTRRPAERSSASHPWR